METIRETLNIDSWVVFGGSWGSTLGLAYAITHPERVRGLILRGIFLARPREVHWLYQHGASELFPDAWEEFLAPIAQAERDDLVSAYHRQLTGSDPRVRLRAAAAWSKWEGAVSFLYPQAQTIEEATQPERALPLARIECHYFVNNGFLECDDQLLRDVPLIRDIPCAIVQGRYDVVCPMRSAWALHRAWPEAQLLVVPDAGHSAFEPGTARALRAATDVFARGQRIKPAAGRSTRPRP